MRFPFFVLLLFIPWSACRAQSNLHLEVGGAHIEVVLNAGPLQLKPAELTRWIQDAAESVAAYYGRFPVSRLAVQITPFDGRGVRNGRTFSTRGGLILIRVGSDTTAQELASDWMMTHEMVHLAFPSVPDRHHWIEEGIATYVEPIARIQAGHFDASTMWAELLRDLPKGLPATGDQGLDNTHTWGRTYWGGALFCFLAEIQIRRETKNEKGLQDALRGILDAGGDIRQEWELEHTLQLGDGATGTHVLVDLYKEMRDKPVGANLYALWEQLGVSLDGDVAHFKDDAKMSAIRRAITAAVPRSKQ